MKRFFPLLNDDTDKGMHFALIAYWIFAFGVMPSWMPLFGGGFWNDLPVISWFEIIYHVLNGLAVVFMLKTYLADSFLTVQLDPKGFLKIAGLSALVMLVLAVGLYSLYGYAMADIYPVSEMIVAVTTGYLVEVQPIFGTICFSLFTPFAVVGLFYAAAFAPVCRRSRWLGYLVVTVALAVPCILDILWRGNAGFVFSAFVLHLPIHWIACWTYQKADTVWAPIITLAVFNFGTSLMTIAQFYF